MAVILDVVYNHVGPDGNYLKQFSEDYFTDRYANEWGEAVNFDGPELRQPCANSSAPTPPIGPASFTSTGCGWMPRNRSSMLPRRTS